MARGPTTLIDLLYKKYRQAKSAPLYYFLNIELAPCIAAKLYSIAEFRLLIPVLN